MIRRPLRAKRTLFEECRIVRAYGELDAQTVAPLVSALAEVRAARPGRLLVIVDLSAVTFADCSILPPLCEAWSDATPGADGSASSTTTTRSAWSSAAPACFPAHANAQDAWEERTSAATAYRTRTGAGIDGR
ncbi:STAS domain-containing protein [Streptomyces sp. NPDC002172]